MFKKVTSGPISIPNSNDPHEKEKSLAEMKKAENTVRKIVARRFTRPAPLAMRPLVASHSIKMGLNKLGATPPESPALIFEMSLAPTRPKPLPSAATPTPSLKEASCRAASSQPGSPPDEELGIFPISIGVTPRSVS